MGDSLNHSQRKQNKIKLVGMSSKLCKNSHATKIQIIDIKLHLSKKFFSLFLYKNIKKLIIKLIYARAQWIQNSWNIWMNQFSAIFCSSHLENLIVVGPAIHSQSHSGLW